MQNKQLSTKRLVELKDNSIIRGLLTTSSEYMAEKICYLDDTCELIVQIGR